MKTMLICENVGTYLWLHISLQEKCHHILYVLQNFCVASACKYLKKENNVQQSQIDENEELTGHRKAEQLVIPTIERILLPCFNKAIFIFNLIFCYLACGFLELSYRDSLRGSRTVTRSQQFCETFL